MKEEKQDKRIRLETDRPIWEHFFTVAPLVVIGTKEGSKYDLAPKHMVTALGHANYFGFVCTPRHGTWQNIRETGEFTVSFLKPEQIVPASLSASPRTGMDKGAKAVLGSLPTLKAEKVDALFLRDSYLFLECKLDRLVEGFGEYGLVAGKIIGAEVEKDYMRQSELDSGEQIEKAPLLAFIAFGRFAVIDDTKAFPFPANFKL